MESSEPMRAFSRAGTTSLNARRGLLLKLARSGTKLNLISLSSGGVYVNGRYYQAFCAAETAPERLGCIEAIITLITSHKPLEQMNLPNFLFCMLAGTRRAYVPFQHL
jgi:hypothetical protein